jgi:hypothetical protein
MKAIITILDLIPDKEAGTLTPVLLLTAFLLLFKIYSFLI